MFRVRHRFRKCRKIIMNNGDNTMEFSHLNNGINNNHNEPA